MNEINSNYNKNLFQLAWPIFADLLLRVLTGSVNILMISQISVLYVASMTVGNQIFGLSIVIFNFVLYLFEHNMKSIFLILWDWEHVFPLRNCWEAGKREN